MAKRDTTHREPQKDPRKADRHTSPRLVFHLPHDLLAAFRAYLGSLRPRPRDAEVLRMALEEFLSRHGFWPAA